MDLDPAPGRDRTDTNTDTGSRAGNSRAGNSGADNFRADNFRAGNFRAGISGAGDNRPIAAWPRLVVTRWRTMPTLKVNETQTTTAGTFMIDAGLAPGRYRYQLIVEDEEGHQSAPVQIIVTVRSHPGGPA